MSVPVHLPSIDGYVFSLAKRNDKLFRRSFQYITPLGEGFDPIRAGCQCYQYVDRAIQVDQMTEACLDWISRKDSRYLVPRSTSSSSPDEMKGSHVAWATKQGHRPINDFTAMQAVLHVAAVQAGGHVEESYLALRESYDELKKAFIDAQIKFGTTSTRTESVENDVKSTTTEESKSVTELRQAVADETRVSVLQWHKSMVNLATGLAATFYQRTANHTSASAA